MKSIAWLCFVVLIVAAPAAAQPAPGDCYALTVLEREWEATARHPSPIDGVWDLDSFPPDPARFRLGEQGFDQLSPNPRRLIPTGAAADVPSVHSATGWRFDGQTLSLRWGSSFLWLHADLARNPDSAKAWNGTMTTFSDEIPLPGEEPGKWIWAVSLEPSSCTDAPSRGVS